MKGGARGFNFLKLEYWVVEDIVRGGAELKVEDVIGGGEGVVKGLRLKVCAVVQSFGLYILLLTGALVASFGQNSGGGMAL